VTGISAKSRFVRLRPLRIGLDAVALLVCVAGVIAIAGKPGLPIRWSDENHAVSINGVDDSALARAVLPGEKLLRIDGQPVSHVEVVEFLFDARHVGDQVSLDVQGSGGVRTVQVVLQAYYGTDYLIIVILVSGLFFGVGMFVLLRRPEDRAARVYHWGSIGTAMMLTTTWGQCGDAASPGLWTRVVFSCAYTLVPLLFFHFALVFPRRSWERVHKLLPVLYGLAFLLGAGSGLTFLLAATARSVDLFHAHLGWFTATRWFLIVLIISGLVTIWRTYFAATGEAEKRRLRWVVWGLFMGFLPFVGLWVVPSIFLSYSLVPESVMLLASGIIPVSFGISIVKYHLMDIDLILNRSVVYGTVMSVLTLLYITLVGVAAGLVTRVTYEHSLVIAGGAAIAVALLFQPLRTAVQRFVDRRFFRVRYDFRRAELVFADAIKHAVSVADLARVLVPRMNELIPVDRIAFLTTKNQDRNLCVVEQRGFEKPADIGLEYPDDATGAAVVLPLALDDAIEPGVPCTRADESAFRTWGISLAVPFPSKSSIVQGFLALGPRKSGMRFVSEDIDLLTSVCAKTGLEMERIRLQSELILQAEESRRLQALNEVKSDFVSYVSHELRTPLTSVKMYAELLRARLPPADRRARTYVKTIEGEADRLNRMVGTILDSSRIEQGIKQYAPRRIDLVQVIRKVVRTMRYQMDKEGFDLELDLPSRRESTGARAPLLPVDADPEAVGQAIENLLTNAMKYSGERKQIAITAARRRGAVFCRVEDHGYGIDAQTMQHLFEKFFRDPGVPRRIQGVGLGLAVVKHIMESHGGRVEVTSTPGSGSVFTLIFPAGRPRQKNTTGD
jgi:signal transduction histidine kinase